MLLQLSNALPLPQPRAKRQEGSISVPGWPKSARVSKSEKHAFLDAGLHIDRSVQLIPLQQQRATSKNNGDAIGERGSSAPT